MTYIERVRVLQIVNSTRFVDLPPIQIYAQPAAAWVNRPADIEVESI